MITVIIIIMTSPGGTTFPKFYVKPRRKDCEFQEAGDHAGYSVATGKVTQTGQVFAEEQEKECATTNPQG
jgi:hypothetical protein